MKMFSKEEIEQHKKRLEEAEKRYYRGEKMFDVQSLKEIAESYKNNDPRSEIPEPKKSDFKKSGFHSMPCMFCKQDIWSCHGETKDLEWICCDRCYEELDS